MSSIVPLLEGKSKEEILDDLEELSDRECLELLYDWEGIWCRENQRPPTGDWLIWLKLAGRGEGKTRVGSEWIIDGAKRGKMRMALIGATYGDVRDIMIEGESGIVACCPPSFQAKYESSKRQVVFPNGAIAKMFAGEEPERLRGPQHHRAWADEVAAWRRVDRRAEAWKNMLLGLRLGENPQVYVSTTPKPIKFLRDLVKNPLCVVRGGSTYDNLENLAATFRTTVVAMYENTAVGAQELDGKLLDEVPGALWQREWFERDRVQLKDVPPLDMTAVALDPNVSGDEEGDDADEAGIVWGGRARIGRDTHYYIGGDLTCDEGPTVWAKRTIECYDVNNLDKIVYEKNQGGVLVAKTMRVAWKESDHKTALPIKAVHASRGKRTRAEPVAMLYEQGKVHHVGRLDHLEDQLCSWVPNASGDSPGRLDADVWLVTHLMESGAVAAGPADATAESRYRH